MAAIQQTTGHNRWVPVTILAHEIGHHRADDRLIAYDVHFDGDPPALINCPAIRCWYLASCYPRKMLISQWRSLPAKSVLLVSKKGQVINTEGRKLGYVSAHDRSN